MNMIDSEFTETLIAAFVAIWPDFLDKQCEAQCPRCLKPFAYRKKEGTHQPKYCLNCVKY